jgi:tRNA-splicing ligase RtcB
MADVRRVPCHGIVSKLTLSGVASLRWNEIRPTATGRCVAACRAGSTSAGGAKWAVECGYGHRDDLERIEERGCMPGARPEHVSAQAKKRQRDEMGTLGSGNHYLEVQKVVQVFDVAVAQAFGVREGEIVISIHCGSRGLGHQIGTEFLKRMVVAAAEYGLSLPDRELACAPISAPVAQEYLGAMRAAINCAFANRQILTHLVRETCAEFFPGTSMPLLYDVSHNTCKVKQHVINGKEKQLFVHRKGATRAFGPGHSVLPAALAAVGRPVLIGGTMGTASYVSSERERIFSGRLVRLVTALGER